MSNQQNSSADMKVADATAGNWVDRHAPEGLRPYMRLARWDRPIGTWLLLWPCWWSTALAATQTTQPYPDVTLLVLFAIGSVAMRGAGCTYNDIVDRDIDAKVERTRSRPIPSGQVSTKAAFVFLVLQCLVGLAVLLSLNTFSIVLGLGSILLVAIYPFMKRVTYWPQLWLGLTFNWGALMGWAAVTGGLDLPALLLYAGAIFWTVGYDTIYAHQDKEDDALVGVKSTALRFGSATKSALVFFYSAAFVLFVAAGWLSGLGLVFYLLMGTVAVHFAGQIRRLDIDNPEVCLRIFKSNRDLGAFFFLAILSGLFLV